VRCGAYSIDDAMEHFWLEPTGLPENQVHQVYGWAPSKAGNSEDPNNDQILQKIYAKKNQWQNALVSPK
jgi:hypothetical protein